MTSQNSTNGNAGERYHNEKWNKPMVAQYGCGHEFLVLAGDKIKSLCHDMDCLGEYIRARQPLPGEIVEAGDENQGPRCGPAAEIKGVRYGYMPETQTMADRYPRYYKDVRHLESVDVYRVHRLFDVTDNEIHHASKKLLLCGVRTGGKPARKEVEEARDTLTRWLEIQDEDART